MKTDRTDEQNPGTEQQASRTRGGVVVDDKSKGADSTSEPEGTRSRGGAVGDDRSKDFGGRDEHPKG